MIKLFMALFMFALVSCGPDVVSRTGKYKWTSVVTSVEYHRSMAPNDDRIIHIADGRTLWCMAYDAKYVKAGDSVGTYIDTWVLSNGKISEDHLFAVENCGSCTHCR